jgi:predicted MFS family arabinose efflux permease
LTAFPGGPEPPGAGPATREPVRRLRHDRNFRLLWTGETVSQVGTAVSAVATPLVAIQVLHSGPFAVGVLAATVWLPWLLIGLPAGAWVDRLPRRPLMLVCNLASLVLLVSVPFAAWVGVLTFAHLAAVMVLVGVAAVFSVTAYQVFLPAAVRPEHLAEANAKVQGSEWAGRVAGPGLAGLLAQAFGAITGLLADAISFAVAAACLLAVRVREPRPARQPHRDLGREVLDGLRYTVADPYLRPLGLYSMASNLADGALQAVLVLFLVQTVGISSATVGALLSVMGIGGLVGALLATSLARRLGTARAMLVAEIGTMPFTLLVPLTTDGPGLAFFVIGVLVNSAGAALSNVIVSLFRQSYCPRAILGRVIASSRCASFGVLPVGALLGGTLATFLGVRTSVWIAAVAQVVSVGILLVGPIRRHRDLPSTGAQAQVGG